MIYTHLAIIGAGMAGLTAAAEAARHGVHVLVIERMGAGGQVMTVERIANIPGWEPVSGFELGPQLQEAAEEAGAQFVLDTVESLSQQDGHFVLHCAGEDVAAHAVLVAAGSKRRKLGVPGEEKLEGRGVSHCAACDGPLFRDQTVCVVGGGDSAFGEAAALADHALQVTVLFREDAPHAQEYLQEALLALPNVQLVPNAEVAEISGEEAVTGLRLRDGRAFEAEGVFVYAGLQADTEFLGAQLARDEHGRIVTDPQLRASLPGVFAAGDIRAGSTYLLAGAQDDGTTAAQAALQYLSEKHRRQA